MNLKSYLDNIWTIPNIMSMIRLALAPVVAHFIYYDQYTLAVIFALIAGLLDIFDGIIARKYEMISEFGKIIDPLADKITYAFVVITMLFKGLLPIWYVILFVARDLIILLGSLIFSKKIDQIPQADQIGKYSIFLNAILIFIILCGVRNIPSLFFVILILLLYLSTANYILKGIKMIKNKKHF